MVFKNNKRPSGEDESCHISFKHSRQLDYSSFEGLVHCNNSPVKPHSSVDEGGRKSSKCQGREKLVTHTVTEISVAGDKEFDNCTFGNISGFSWGTGIASEKDAPSEPAIHVSCSPGYCDHSCPARTSIESETMFSSLIDYPPRKLVSIGPDHQADIPVWRPEVANKASDHLGMSNQGASGLGTRASSPSSLVPLSAPSCHVIPDNCEQLTGTCVIPVSEVESSGCNTERVGHGRADCSCTDVGSVRCVRQHVKKAREKLCATLGQERFVKLGFCDMGEDVAQKWSEEEEQIFHEVVFSNPVSLGRDFWEHISVVFPTRSRKDLVSYYFNVFMLRKRAEQNRLDPLNIDSDNDEWQVGDDGDEFAITEEDEDSIVESPADQENTVYNEDVYHEDDEDEDDDGDDDGGGGNDAIIGGVGDVVAVEEVGGLDDVPELQMFNSKRNSHDSLDSNKYVPTDHLASNDLWNGSGEQDLQDESCTSYECIHSGAVSSGPSDASVAQERVETDHKLFKSEYGNGSLGDMVDHGYVSEACDAKVWDSGVFTITKGHTDFLPTCSMIEEVFRNELWNDNEVRDDHCIS